MSDLTYLGVDTGGTFTDFVCVQMSQQGHLVRIHKVLSTPTAPEQAILQGIAELGLQAAITAGTLVVVHGSTVATNAALERKGVKTAYVTNTGFADVLTLGRQARPNIYALQPQAPPAPVPAALCFEVDCRIDAQGREVQALTSESVDALCEAISAQQPAAVAINFLFAYLNDAHEQRIKQALGDAYFVSTSTEVLPEYKEYERGMATWLNAWLGPIVYGYLQRLQQGLGSVPLGIMQSNGGTIDAKQASRRAVNLLLSGPAGGLAAVKALAQRRTNQKILTFDMGGTSTDVALIDGDINLTTESKIGSFPVAVPMVDMHTVGAGGGSVAYLDDAGMLHVGPESAGADPGPACYGRGGQQATVSDANVVLGRLQPDYFLGGDMSLDVQAATQVMQPLAKALGLSVEQAAQGILSLANEHIVAALRVISVERGHDPADFELCCFGGAGGLQVCAVAEALGIARILMPAHGGVLSALGMIVAPKSRHFSQTLSAEDKQSLEAMLKVSKHLLSIAKRELEAEGVSDDVDLSAATWLDCRYQGQSFTLQVPLKAACDYRQAFTEAHQERYGYILDLPVEAVNLRVSLSAPAALGSSDLGQPSQPVTSLQAAKRLRTAEHESLNMWERAAIPQGEFIEGPALICETTTTTYVAPGWQAQRVDGEHIELCRLA